MTHGCSPFALTRRNLMPLDIVTGHSLLPGRDDVALLLEETMRSQGWTGGKIEENRRLLDERRRRKGKQRNVRADVSTVLGVSLKWWGFHSELAESSDSESEDEEPPDETLFVSPPTLLFPLTSQ
jgi:hypothetical protein